VGPRREGAAADAVGHLMNHGQLRRRTSELQSATRQLTFDGCTWQLRQLYKASQREKFPSSAAKSIIPRLYIQDSTAKCIGGNTTLDGGFRVEGDLAMALLKLSFDVSALTASCISNGGGSQRQGFKCRMAADHRNKVQASM
jgi:hypothetical protein